MKSKRSRLAIVGILALALSVTVGLGAGSAQAAKKKKVGGTVDVTQTVNGAIPDPPAGPPFTNGTLQSDITVGGKKFKGSKIRDVNVTVQTQATAGATPASDLRFRLTAPDGTTTWLVGFGFLAGTSVGPLTFDDETPVNLGGVPPAPDTTTLVAPYNGTIQPHCFSALGGCQLGNMDNGSASGTWSLRVQDGATTARRATSSRGVWC